MVRCTDFPFFVCFVTKDYITFVFLLRAPHAWLIARTIILNVNVHTHPMLFVVVKITLQNEYEVRLK